MERFPDIANSFRVRQVTYENVNIMTAITTAIRRAGNIEPRRMNSTRQQLRQYVREMLEQQAANLAISDRRPHIIY